MGSQDFCELEEHRYATSGTTQAFTFIRQRLTSLGYHGDNDNMVHDYLHFVILDLLAAEETPFLSESNLLGMQRSCHSSATSLLIS
ncbi:hypothetical protein EON65_17480 [archaeon]|nr:MAG: hypothetical protein EON65_17480 [archaeon]